MVPKDVHILIFQAFKYIRSHVKRDFVYVIKNPKVGTVTRINQLG